MSTGNCKDCNYWRFHHDGFNTSWHECDKADWVELKEALPDDSMGVYSYALDDSGLRAGLRTGPMFGCIQFKPN